MKTNHLFFCLLFGACTLGCNDKPLSIKGTPLDSGTKSLLQAISIVDDNTAWISGHDATFARTKDAGNSWEIFTYEKGDSLQFRDLHAVSADEIILMAAGPGKKSQILLFSPATGFEETYVMPYEQGFLNSIEFWDNQKGLAFGDSFNGDLFAMITRDGGQSWERIAPSKMPAAGEGEGGFAASGTCISMQPGGKAWIGTGAGGNSRVLYTEDYGNSWTYYEVPTIKGKVAGIESIHMVDEQTGLIVGGDLTQPDAYTDNAAFTKDGGKTWTLTNHPITKGAFYGSDIIPYRNGYLILACGPNGIDYSSDMGQTFTTLDTANYWAVDVDINGRGYATGKNGRILKITID